MYSFTEKKRIRKSFAKQQRVLDVPGLLATQLKSYDQFLQRFVSPNSREIVGLEAAFNSVFPIESSSGNAKLDYLGYSFGSSAFDVSECIVRGLTFGVPLKAKIRLTIFDKESNKKNVKEIKESEVYLGEIPLMTDNGSFVINGTQRVVVSQLHRSPGVFSNMIEARLMLLVSFYFQLESYLIEDLGLILSLITKIFYILELIEDVSYQ